MRLAIITNKEEPAALETFVAMSRAGLKAEKIGLWGRPLPWRGEDGKTLFPPTGKVDRLKYFITARVGRLTQKAIHLKVLADYLRAEKVDVALAHFAFVGANAVDYCRMAKVPLVVHCHGFDVHQDAMITNLESFEKIGDYAYAVIAVSKRMVEALVELGVPHEKIVLRPCAVDLAKFAPTDPSNNPPHFLSVGRMVDKKAPYLTLFAFAQIAEANPQARLTMIGTGELEETTRNICHALKLDDRVDFTGRLPHSQVADHMRSSRVFVQHSVQTRHGQKRGDCEGTPVAILEASATGLPVIATRHSGINEAVLDGKTGLLVDEHDVDGMAEEMQTLANDPGLAERMGQAGRDHISKNYDSRTYLNHLQRILEDAAGSRRDAFITRGHAEPPILRDAGVIPPTSSISSAEVKAAQ